MTNVEFVQGYIEEPPVAAATFDCVMSNGVVNLSPDKPAGFTIEAWRENPEYQFVSDQADNATDKHGVTSISPLARRR